MTITRETVLEALRAVADPAGGDIVASGVMKALTLDGGTVRFVIEVAPDQVGLYTAVRSAAEAAVRALPGVEHASVVMTAHETRKAPPDLKASKPAARPQPQGPVPVPGVKHIVAVASGKGGVGKSTVSANLACALVAEGRRVGLLDADVYGPSQPRMLGVSERPQSADGKTILPLEAHGLKMMSMGLMMEERTAVVWRGPMLMSALQQMLMQVDWGDLDVLIIDLPPGTGDVQITVAQKAVVDGAVIVSTPQDIALLDARKAIDMFGKTGVRVLGMIENMSTHICSNCGHEEHLFGHGGVAAEAASLGVPLLAEVPLSLGIRVAADGGTPMVAADPDSPQAAPFRAVARALIERWVA